MRCKKCGLEQAPWKKFCGQCGEAQIPRKSASSKRLTAIVATVICVIVFISGTMYAFGDHAKQSRYEKKAKQLEATNPEKALEYAEKSVLLGGSKDLAKEIQMTLYSKQLNEFTKGRNYIEAVKIAQKMLAQNDTKENTALVSKSYVSLYDQDPTLDNLKYLEAACAVQKNPTLEERLQAEYVTYGEKPAPVQKANATDGYRDILHLDTKLLTSADLASLPKEEYKFIRNEIFARHGRIFTSSRYLNYFRQFSWYNPRFTDSEIILSPIERENVNLIRSLE